ncbi:alpha,alpha-trehalose-phosphate synthase (UDP-forming) [Sphingomonas jeddahensis]|uniref:Alpha,alpha-trehalose-phosphate synthase n=1 Tax=Sphingomonas jeddahensis TaxID=1915074 RepID=A0A1V2EYT5_9SPHN|nr:trehalose-6-phosphate synthase [Sphingomonas jeddahensis]ONF97448.1 Alpha,alpha-trehalose-phosphate synthase [Sphingomonas jeddahensis]
MSRLIVISNRVSAPTAEQPSAQGGLAVALTAALREADGIWFGWSGQTGETGDLKFETYDGVTSATIDLPEQDVEEYYDGYANRTLWPLFHYRLGLTEFERDFQGGYERVNRLFADVISPHIEPNDLVWVHDYHMIPLGWMLRQQGIKSRLGFFLHIPWPPARLLIALPEHRRLVEALFGYDVVGFQTQEWLETFHDYVEREMGGTIGENGDVTVGGRTIKAIACPIGIDAKEFIANANGPTAQATHERMMESVTGRDLIVGVDRLDYSKGIEERFNGYQRYLETRPEMRTNVSLLQIAPPSRATVQSYQEIRATLDALSGRINGAFAEIDWVPLRYVNRGLPRDVLAGAYRAARVGLVTPLRDGMNLVAKEFVAAQDPEDPGVLILSRFAGAAEQLTEALLINPYSPDEMADAIEQALAMPPDERIARWRKMYDNVVNEDVIWWRKRFTDVLTAVEPVAA